MNQAYIDILVTSLQKKSKLLDQILTCNEEQKELLKEISLDPDVLEKNLHDKGKLIDEITKLDEGFEQLYQKVKEELSVNKEQYKPQIGQMQKLIMEITEKGNEIQVEEARNHDAILRKFSTVKKQFKQITNNKKAINEYARTMRKQVNDTSFFLDNKK
ncbi:MAG: flagellar export chaperone FlgN [Lachnospiraceae bacterium]